MRFIGDIHGNDYNYLNYLTNCDKSTQVGDFGFGFNPYWDERMFDWQSSYPTHKFIRGNHDDPKVCRKAPNYLGDYGVTEDGIFFVSGAWSFDYGARREGVSYWVDEELSSGEFDQVEKLYLETQPTIVVSHDAPLGIPDEMKLYEGTMIYTRTAVRLARMFRRHQPKLWLFGHWHKDKQEVLGGCNFVCIGIDNAVDVNLETLEVKTVN